MSFRKPLIMGALVVGVMLVACDSGPSGPGTLVASVQGDALGGVVLEVRGRGILGFEGLSSTQVYAAPIAGSDAHRVMLIHPSAGDLRFEIQVEDAGMDDPEIHVVSAAGLDNASLLNAGIEVRIERD